MMLIVNLNNVTCSFQNQPCNLDLICCSGLECYEQTVCISLNQNWETWASFLTLITIIIIIFQYIWYYNLRYNNLK